MSDVTSEPGKWLLAEYGRTPGDPKWYPGMGLESTIVAIESEVRRQTVIEMENEGVVTWGDPRHRARFLEDE